MSENVKIELVNATYEFLQQMSPSKVTARMIADKVGCTNPTIYYHFDNLDHLILIASMRFFDDYLAKFKKITETDKELTPFELHMKAWRMFGEIAFAHLEVYESLFWGKFRDKTSEALIEYHELFPDSKPNIDNMYSVIFFMDALEDRTYIMLKMAAAAGEIPADNLHMFADVQCSLFHGILLDYVDCYWDKQKAKEGLEKAMQMLEFVNSLYRLSKTK